MKKTLSARVDSKTKEEVEKLAEERDNSISNMTQQLVREGIEKETQSQSEPQVQSQSQGSKSDVTQNKLSWILLGIGVSFIILWLGLSIPSIVTIPVSLIIAAGIVFDNISLEAI